MATDEQDLARIIRAEMLQRAIDHLVGQGSSRETARVLVEQALSAPSHFPIPTLEELERDAAINTGC